MTRGIFQILANERIARDVFRLCLAGDAGAVRAPGQFVNIALDGFYLRRPISVCDWTADSLTLLYKTVGRGTAALAGMRPGETLDLLVGLGNGFACERSGDRPLVIGGGVGTPPMFGLAKALLAAGKQPTAVLGFNTAADAFYLDEFQALGIPVLVATADGGLGTPGFVTDAVARQRPLYDYYFACGPEPMLRALYDALPTDGQLSFEERMACGFGVCMGCSCQTKYGSRRICRDGPVLCKEEILW